jgi:PTH2 family peptidyl-tRNA hydrolase
MIAQGAHASMACILNLATTVSMYRHARALQIPLNDVLDDWLNGTFTKICVGVDSEEELLDIYNQAKDAKLICSLIKDAGLTEFGGVPTLTAVGIGPADSKDIDKITGELKLL